jgi:hypothetical protein
VVLNFGANPVNVPNSTTLGGHTSVSTPAGAYELTITATEAPTKAGPHSTKVWLIVNPCTETPIPVVSQDVFNVQVEEGQNLASDSVFVTNDAVCGSLNWLASSDQPWVTPDPNQGLVNAGETPGSMMYLVYNTSALVSNSYVAYVTVGEEEKTRSAVITINLTVNPKPPTVCVSGTITDVGHNPISGAIVELFDIYRPSGNDCYNTLMLMDFTSFGLPPETGDVYSARLQTGYYPDYRETGLPTTDLVLILRPNDGTVTPTYEWPTLLQYFALSGPRCSRVA